MLTSALECFSFFERPASVGLKMSVKMTEQDRNERLIRGLYYLAEAASKDTQQFVSLFCGRRLLLYGCSPISWRRSPGTYVPPLPSQVKMQQPFVGILMSID
jgi:hypothetical protein